MLTTNQFCTRAFNFLHESAQRTELYNIIGFYNNKDHESEEDVRTHKIGQLSDKNTRYFIYESSSETNVSGES